ncbi:DegV family protein [Deinococcus sp.]|uniref:DegV family protein n=1 Tax=Deinococcus sp. TaxID=47478 RepID=UPI0025B8E1AD|nr:DegV family protein [Deinococcus sp.]
MSRIAVLTDSYSDLNETQAAAFSVHLLLLRVKFGGGEWLDHPFPGAHALDNELLFKQIRTGAKVPTLLLPSLETYLGCIDSLLETHEHVLILHTGPLLGRMYRFALQATAHLADRVTVFGGGTTSGGLALQAIRAAELVRKGHDIPAIVRLLRDFQAQHCAQVCLNTLEYLRRGHLISSFTEMFGTMQNMKPIFGVVGGRLSPVANLRGEKAALAQMVQDMQSYAARHPGARIVFMHNGESKALAVLRVEGQRLGLTEVADLEIGAVMSSFVGPEAYAFCLEPEILPLLASDRRD